MIALEAMLDLMDQQYKLARRDAMALASLVWTCISLNPSTVAFAEFMRFFQMKPFGLARTFIINFLCYFLLPFSVILISANVLD